MKNDTITLNIDGISKKYKLLFIIDDEYKYIAYTDLENNDITKNINVFKTKSLNNNEKNIPITNDEWEMIENKYQELIKKNA